MSEPRIKSFDHVALWTDERDALAAFFCDPLGMHVIERTDDFTLLGADARQGKVTLFDAEGPRQPGVLQSVGVKVEDLETVTASASEHADPEQREDGVSLLAPGGVRVNLVQRPGLPFDLDHVSLTVPDPEATMEELVEMGFERENGGLKVAERRVLLERGDPGTPERPQLNHLALLVDSADQAKRLSERTGHAVEKEVDAANTRAVFLRGPDGIVVEYVEHKPGFSLE